MVFAAVVDAKGFSAAGCVLRRPKSSISRSVSRLEARLDTQLLARTTRSLSLTEVGRAYYDRAIRALEQLEDAERFALERSHQPGGTLRITAPIDFGGDLLAKVLTDFQAHYPDIRLVISFSNRQIDMTAEGFDIAIRAGRLQDSSLVMKRLVTSRARLFASPVYLKKHGTPDPPESLKAHRCLIFGRSANASWQLTREGKQVEVRLQRAVCADDYGFLHRLVLRGEGIARLPWVIVRDSEAQGRLQAVLPDYCGVESHVSLVYPSAHHLPAKTRAFIDFAAAALSDSLQPAGELMLRRS